MTGRRLAMLLPGQGSQYAGMAVELYEREPEFTSIVDEFFHHMGADGALVRDRWLRDGAGVDEGTQAQPLLFAVGYAIAKMLHDRGLRPDVLVGHSVGELAAACLAGVFDLPGAARILVGRGRALAAAPAGGMLGVAASREDVEGCVEPRWAARGVVVGAVNAPQQTVLSGPDPELSQAEQAIREAGFTARRVRATEPWHSPAMDQAAELFELAVAAEPLHRPELPIVSGRTGQRVTDEQAVDPSFWARQMAEPVLFWPALDTALEDHTVVEAGQGLAMLARRHPAVRRGGSEVISLLPSAGRPGWETWKKGLSRIDCTTLVEADDFV
ncbi:acyltransferase domain-containing protein [Saccharopolyspora taberi]|uniref:Malonyl-CoA:ACP transacylase (MAT) domain-containing protein n=1 Tax=Saccharopolyspora taberi TaxID=60895 RepID=A0ABN3VBN5_9PSEU